MPNGIAELEYVSSEQLFEFVDDNYRETPKSEISRMVGMHDRRFYSLRAQKYVSLGTADKILTKLDLHHLLATGEITVYSDAEQKIHNLEQQLATLQRQKRELAALVKRWKLCSKQLERDLKAAARRNEVLRGVANKNA